ncbi:RNA-directed DNA polymerase, eukaryota [Tanacetum coccineum]|uniref:RNA-directed DNA polymerase, eukaryota n=1 Tax=Tanacetum coccineum TaxID=301880 RepID=A0ABQ5HHK2_9ASTR
MVRVRAWKKLIQRLLHGSVNISHLFYADDAMFIGEWSEQNLHNIVKVLNCFHLASGLKINIAKSQVLGVGVSQNVVVQAANRIGCAVLNTPFRYLGRRKISWVAWDNDHSVQTERWFGVSQVSSALKSCLLTFDVAFSSCLLSNWMFALELDKEIVVANKMGASSVSASFRRDVRDGAERQQWDDLSSILNSVVLSSSKDRWTCDLSGDGEFKVKVIRNFIDDLFLPSSDVETRWVKFIPIKVNVFSWRARRDRLPTRVNLSRRGVLLDSHLCPLCNAAMEDVQHVFFRCDVARVVLRKICRWWDLDWQEICSFSDWDAWFLSFRLSSRLKSILEGVFYVAWWRIWRLRNQLVFDASPPNRSTIFDDIVSWSFLWCSSRCNRVFSWEYWLKNPYLISL